MKPSVVFCHEDSGGQLIWALPWYVTVDIQGPEEAFYLKKNPNNQLHQQWAMQSQQLIHQRVLKMTQINKMMHQPLSHQLIENDYFNQEAESQCCRPTRIQEGIGHGLMSLQPFKIFLGSQMVSSDSKYPPPPPVQCLQKRGADLLQMHSRCPYL